MSTPDYAQDRPEWRTKEFWFFLAIMLAVWSSVYLFDLGRRELIHEEGRRALLAREMTARGDYWIATVFHETYLNKPPGYPWLILGISRLSGGVDEWSVRLTSSLGMLFSAILIFFFASDSISLRARFMASILFLLTFMSLEKGRLGEIESCFTALVWAALCCSWRSLQSPYRDWIWAVLSGVCLSASLFVKGPPALLFFYGTLLFYSFQMKRLRWILTWNHALTAGLALGLFSVWLIPVLQKVGWQAMAETGTREMVLRGGGVAKFFDEQSSLISNTFVGLLPGSLFLLAYFWRNRWRWMEKSADPQIYLLACTLSALLFFLYFPGARARYLHPIAPAVALLAAVVWERAQTESALRPLATVFYVVLGVMGITGIGTVYSLAALIPQRILLLTALGMFCLVFVIWMRIEWTKRFSFPAILLQVALLWTLSQIGVMARDSKLLFQLPVRQSAMLESTYVPDEETIYTLTMSDFNLYYYVKNPVRFIDSLAELKRDGRAYYVAYRYLDDAQQFDRWMILDHQVIPLSAKESVWILKIQ